MSLEICQNHAVVELIKSCSSICQSLTEVVALKFVSLVEVASFRNLSQSCNNSITSKKIAHKSVKVLQLWN